MLKMKIHWCNYFFVCFAAVGFNLMTTAAFVNGNILSLFCMWHMKPPGESENGCYCLKLLPYFVTWLTGMADPKEFYFWWVCIKQLWKGLCTVLSYVWKPNFTIVFLEKFQNSVMIILTNFSLTPLHMLYELFVNEINYSALTPFSFGPIQFSDLPLFDTILSNFWLFFIRNKRTYSPSFPPFPDWLRTLLWIFHTGWKGTTPLESIWKWSI